MDLAAVVGEGDAVVEGADREPEYVVLPLRGLVHRVQLPPGIGGEKNRATLKGMVWDARIGPESSVAGRSTVKSASTQTPLCLDNALQSLKSIFL